MPEEEEEAIESFRVENDKDISEFEKFNEYTKLKIMRNKMILNLIQEQQVELAEKDLELEKKDKIISEMSNAMAKNYCCIANVVEEEICDKKCIGNNDWHCETCIKQYFERKAEK